MGGTLLARFLAIAVASGCAATALLAPSVTFAQPGGSKADEAKARYLKGVDLFDEGDYQSALIEFKRSYELVPNFNVLYNIGQVHFQLADYANALKTLQQYLDEGQKRIPASRRTDVERDVDKLRSRVAQVTIKVNVQGAEVKVDDQAAQAITGPVIVSAGKRRFEVSKAGYKSVLRTEEIAGQENKELVFELQPEATVISGGSGDQPPVVVVGGGTVQQEPGPPIVPIVLWSVTGALAISTGVMGGLALSTDGSLQELKRTPGTSEADLTSKADEAATFALVSDILLGGTIAAAGAATIFTVLELTSESTPTQEAPANPAPTARLRGAPGFLFLEGTF